MSLFDWDNPKLYNPESRLCDWLLVAILTFVCMLVMVDLLAATVAQSEIQGALSLNDTQAVWIGKTFFYFSALAPLYALRLASNYGYKRTIFLGAIIFFIGSTTTAFASNYPLLLCSRSLTGCGGGILLAISLGYISQALPRAMRERALIIYSNSFFGLGIAGGLLIGGYLGQAYLWKEIFLLNFFVMGPLFLLMLLFFPETPPVPRNRYDFISLLAIALFFFALLLIVTQAKAPWNTAGWRSPFIFSCTVGAIAAALLFLVRSLTAAEPLICFKLFTHPRYLMGCLGMGVIGFMIFGVTIELMGLLESVYLYERWTIGWFVSCVGFIYFLFGALPMLLIHLIHPRLFVIAGMLLIIYSCFMHQTITIQSDMAEIAAALIARSVGIALVLGPLMVLALFHIEDALMTKATAFISFIRLMGATFGSGLISLVVQMRQPYHSLRFGEQVNVQSPRYQQYIENYIFHLQGDSGSGPATNAKQAKLLLIQNIEGQATIAAFNDALFLLGWATMAIFAAIAGLMLFRIWSNSRKPSGAGEAELGF